jgi:succinate dehydrogenase / fumarate reductase cytochrome b subunit
MGITGLALCGFALMHMSGNFLLLKNQDAFNQYAKFLHEIPGFLFIELGLLVTFIIHIALAIQLAIENRAARPQKYVVNKSAGGATLGSQSMPYTGIFFIFFLIVHLLNIKFDILPAIHPADVMLGGEMVHDKYSVVAGVLANPLLAGFYFIASLILGVHLSHGFQSSFQSLGYDSPEVTPTLKKASILFGLVIAGGYSVITIYMLTQGGI